MQQAARVSDYTGFMYLGKLIECGKQTRSSSIRQKNLPRIILPDDSGRWDIMTEKFHSELKNSRQDTGDGSPRAIHVAYAVDALSGRIMLAASVIGRKDEIHPMEVRLEEYCYQLIAMNQPMAKDMRVLPARSK